MWILIRNDHTGKLAFGLKSGNTMADPLGGHDKVCYGSPFAPWLVYSLLFRIP